MENKEFIKRRRQIYLDEDSYRHTLGHIRSENALNVQALQEPLTERGRKTTLDLIASNKWTVFQLQYTAGEKLTELAESLDDIVLAYEQYVDAAQAMPDDAYMPPFVMNDVIDTYVDYLNLLCVAILLRREELIPRIHALNAGTDFDEADAVLEELFGRFLPDRPELDDWLWDQPYRKLLDAIDDDTPQAMAKGMKLYVKSWYKDMKGVAHFWGKHAEIEADFTPYEGYWAMCAAAFTYLLELDDSAYRAETVYPADMVDYALSLPDTVRAREGEARLLRVEGGDICPRDGRWYAPAQADSTRHFTRGERMPDFPDAKYGRTIWQWIGE